MRRTRSANVYHSCLSRSKELVPPFGVRVRLRAPNFAWTVDILGTRSQVSRAWTYLSFSPSLEHKMEHPSQQCPSLQSQKECKKKIDEDVRGS